MTPQAEPPVSDDDIRQYLSDIRQYPRLTREQELALARGCAQGDEEAIRRMVTSNLRLVVSVAREYAGRGVGLLDLIQEGSIGLLTAARKFDYTMDYRFSTYATKWIRQGITRCILNRGAIRVPQHTAERMQKLEAVRYELRKTYGGEPSEEALAAALGIPTEKVRILQQLNPEVCSLDAEAVEDGKAALSSLLEDTEAPDPHEGLVRQELSQLLNQLLGQLNQRQQTVLRLHYGLEDGSVHSFEEIGKLLNISKERTRQIERQAMEKLLAEGEKIGLEDFLE